MQATLERPAPPKPKHLEWCMRHCGIYKTAQAVRRCVEFYQHECRNEVQCPEDASNDE